MNSYIDIHTHYIKNFSDVEEVFIVPLHEDNDLFDFEKKFCIGIHPWFINKKPKEDFEKFVTKYKSHKNFFALGEIGLDKNSEQNFEEQIKVFKMQVEIASKLKIKLIVLHCVKAYQEIFQVLKDFDYKGAILLHDFHGNDQIFSQFSNHFQTYISLSIKGLTKINAKEKIAKIPLDRIFFETDDESFHIKELYRTYAEKFDFEEKLLINQIKENFKRLNKS